MKQLPFSRCGLPTEQRTCIKYIRDLSKFLRMKLRVSQITNEQIKLRDSVTYFCETGLCMTLKARCVNLDDQVSMFEAVYQLIAKIYTQ